MEWTIKRQFLFLAGGLLIGAAAGFALSYRYHAHRLETMGAEVASLSGLEAEYAQQQQALVNLEMADRVNKLAQEKLRRRVNELQTERVQLESELYVYKKLLEDNEAKAGLSVESLLIHRVEGEDRRFTYDIVLSRTSDLDQSTEISLSAYIEGKLHGIRYSLPFKEADPDLHEDSLAVSFRYFKVVKGTLELPEHFDPATVVLSLYEPGQADSLVIKEVPWESSGY